MPNFKFKAVKKLKHFIILFTIIWNRDDNYKRRYKFRCRYSYLSLLGCYLNMKLFTRQLREIVLEIAQESAVDIIIVRDICKRKANYI